MKHPEQYADFDHIAGVAYNQNAAADFQQLLNIESAQSQDMMDTFEEWIRLISIIDFHAKDLDLKDIEHILDASESIETYDAEFLVLLHNVREPALILKILKIENEHVEDVLHNFMDAYMRNYNQYLDQIFLHLEDPQKHPIDKLKLQLERACAMDTFKELIKFVKNVRKTSDI